MDLQQWLLTNAVAGLALIALLWIGRTMVVFKNDSFTIINAFKNEINLQITKFTTEIAAEIKSTNRHVENILQEMHKVNEHDRDIAVLKSNVLVIKELDDRLRNVEYVKRNSNS